MALSKAQSKDKYLNILSEVSSLYYEKNMTQSEIAEMMCISRSRVSRLLKEAKMQKIVTFKVKKIGKRSYGLENIIKRKYNLEDVFVINESFQNEIYPTANIEYSSINLLSKYAARYIENNLSSSMCIGMSWGRSVSNVVDNLSIQSKQNKKDISVVQVVGSLLSDSCQVEQMGTVIKMVEKLNAKGYFLQAPLYFDDIDLKKALMKQRVISNVLNIAKSSDILLTGIGDMHYDSFSFMWHSFGSSNLLNELENNQGVGFICGQCYSIDGKPIKNDFNDHIMGINLEQVKKIPKVVAVAGGEKKGKAVLGALRGGYLDVLVTDRECVAGLI